MPGYLPLFRVSIDFIRWCHYYLPAKQLQPNEYWSPGGYATGQLPRLASRFFTPVHRYWSRHWCGAAAASRALMLVCSINMLIDTAHSYVDNSIPYHAGVKSSTMLGYSFRIDNIVMWRLTSLLMSHRREFAMRLLAEAWFHARARFRLLLHSLNASKAERAITQNARRATPLISDNNISITRVLSPQFFF